MPLVIMIGLIVIIVGAILLQKGRQDQMTAVSQKQSAQALSVAEAGITRIQNLVLGTYAPLYPDCETVVPSDAPAGWDSAKMGRNSSGVCLNDGGGTTSPVLSWANMTSTNSVVKSNLNVCSGNPGTGPDSIDRSTLIKAVALNNQTWQSLDSTNPSKGQYRIVSYRFTPQASPSPSYLPKPPGTGILTIEGRVNQSDGNNATARIEVSIPLTPNTTPFSVPGVWITNGGTGNNTINGDVLLNDCNVALNTINVVSGNKVTYTNQQFPTRPTVTCTGFGNSSNNFSFAGSGTSPTSLNYLESPSGTITLPRGTDQDDVPGSTEGTYHYCVNEVAFNSGTNRITITAGKKVQFYLGKSINVGANSEIVHNCTGYSGSGSCVPTDFQIYGYDDSTSPQPSICLTGNNYLETFILAPAYKVGVAGSGGGAGGIKGSVWAKQWSNGGGCGSNTSNIVVVQTAEWNELVDNLGLPQYRPPALSPISNWSRRQVQ
ncbi:hypothetical protein OLK001_10660 [Synechocystis sp. LKSZ1]